MLFLGRVVNALGSSVAPIALAFAVIQSGGSGTDLGLVLGSYIIPQVLFLVLGGVLADRFSRITIVVSANIVSACGQLLMALVLASGGSPLWQICAISALNGCAVAFFLPASQGLLPQTVPQHQLREANALIRLALNIVQVAGPAIGGAMIAWVGPSWIIAWDAATFAVAAVVFAFMRIPRTTMSTDSFVRDLRDGWSEFWSRTWLWAIVVQYSLVNLIWVGGFQIIGPVVADRKFDGPVTWGFVMAGLGAGLIIGALIATWRRFSRPLVASSLATLTKIAPFAAFAAGAPVPVVVAGAVIAGVGMEIFEVSFTTVVQEQIPLEKLSRVFSYDILLGVGLAPLGYIAAGPAADVFGVDTTLWVASVIVVLSTVAVLLSRQVRTTRHAHSPEADPSRVEDAPEPAR
ncbi:MFS transporter [Saccharothrix stipae]